MPATPTRTPTPETTPDPLTGKPLPACIAEGVTVERGVCRCRDGHRVRLDADGCWEHAEALARAVRKATAEPKEAC